jgi:hypothetical protein
MPQLDRVTVRNTNSGQRWVTGEQASAPDLPLPVDSSYRVYVNAAPQNQPPVGFLNTPNHEFVVEGRYVPTGQAFESGLLMYDDQQSDPGVVEVFKFYPPSHP